MDWLMHVSSVGDGNTLTSADPNTRLVSSHPARSDCGDREAAFGAVYDIEAMLRLGLIR